MPNTIATPTWVLNDLAFEYKNSLAFASNCDMQYSRQYEQAGAKVGDSVSVRLPPRFTVTYGEALQTQALYDETATLRLIRQAQTSMSWSSREATTEIQRVRERYTKKAASALANSVDAVVFANVYKDVYSSVGTPGSGPPTTQSTYSDATIKLIDQACVLASCAAVLDPAQSANLAGTISTLFHAPAGDALRKGFMGSKALGVGNWYYDQNSPAHVTGTYTASTPLVNGASQTGSTLTTDGWASGASSLKAGDIFTVANVYSVNPESKVSTGRLQQFVVTADISDTTGAMVIAISPSIITSGALQTVSASPANNAVITVLGTTAAAGGTLAAYTSKQGMIFLPEAFAVVSADLDMPSAGCRSTRVAGQKLGFSIRMVEQYQIGTDQNPTRLDILYGEGTIRPGAACRIWS